MVGGLIILFGVLLASVTFYIYQIFFTPNVLVKAGKMRLKIPTGATFQTVLDSLSANKALTDPLSFSLVAKIMDYQESVKPGLYLIPPDMSNRDFVKLMMRGEQLPVNLTLSNARLKTELVQKVCTHIEAKPEDLLALLQNPERCEKAGFDTTKILCMFLPNTYQVYWTYTAEKVFERFYTEYKRFWTEERLQKAHQLNLTPIQVSILASIVEAETQKSDERPRVAGVYLNRLKKQIPLQADPTVVYAIGDFNIRRVLTIHTQMDSPYNTYKTVGLPPGPINVPSLNAIEAVLNAENHRYIYFCAKEDLSGYHTFAETLVQHNENARRYRAALNQMRIYR